MKSWTRDLVFVLALVTIGVLGRYVPHAPNATPVAAAALFAGFVVRRRWLAMTVPLATLTLSDAFFRGGYDVRVMAVVYVSMAGLVVLRPCLGSGTRAIRVLGCSLTGSTLFFLTTNLSVWASGWGYAPTWTGLVTCYWNGLPFLWNAIVGDAFWCGVLFGGYAVARHASRVLAARTRPDIAAVPG